jgi:hypothetical protein
VSTFPRELDKAFARRMKELGRDLTREEGEVLEGKLFESWIEAGRYDELICRMHAVYDREGGLVECVVLGEALQKAGDIARIDALFQGLIKRRANAFWANWKQAQAGHPGHMRGCARQAAELMDVYLEYYIRAANLGLDDRKDQIRQKMLAFQARERVGASSKLRK